MVFVFLCDGLSPIIQSRFSDHDCLTEMRFFGSWYWPDVDYSGHIIRNIDIFGSWYCVLSKLALVKVAFPSWSLWKFCGKNNEYMFFFASSTPVATGVGTKQGHQYLFSFCDIFFYGARPHRRGDINEGLFFALPSLTGAGAWRGTMSLWVLFLYGNRNILIEYWHYSNCPAVHNFGDEKDNIKVRFLPNKQFTLSKLLILQLYLSRLTIALATSIFL